MLDIKGKIFAEVANGSKWAADKLPEFKGLGADEIKKGIGEIEKRFLPKGIQPNTGLKTPEALPETFRFKAKVDFRDFQNLERHFVKHSPGVNRLLGGIEGSMSRLGFSAATTSSTVGTLGTSVGAATAGQIAVVAGVGLIAGAAVGTAMGYSIDKALEAGTGKNLGDHLLDVFGPPNPNRALLRGAAFFGLA